MSKVKLNRREQRSLRVISKIVSIVAKILKVLMIIVIPFIVLVMIIVPVVVKHVEVKNNEISWVDKGKQITIRNGENKLEVVHNDKVVAESVGTSIDFKVFDSIKKNSKSAIIASFEAGMLLALFEVIFVMIILNNVEKLFRNISREDTPFTLENVIRVRRIAYFMAFTLIFGVVQQIPFAMLIDADHSGRGTFNITELLIVFASMYIFKYGYEIQKDSDCKIYGELEEEKKKSKSKKEDK